MPQGLQVLNEAGQVVIDPSLKNFGLIATGRVTPGSPIGDGSMRYADISFSGRSTPILALNAGGNWVGLLGLTVSGSQYTWRVLTLGLGVNVDYWLFDETPSDVSFGLEVFNESGQRVFHSGIGGMRVVGFEQNGQGAGNDFSGSVSEKIAIAQNRPATFEFFRSNSGDEIGSGGDGRDGELIRYVHGVSFPDSLEYTVNYNKFTGATASSGSDIFDPVPDLLIIDVSNQGPYGEGDPPPDITPNSLNWANITSTTSNQAENSNLTIGGIDSIITLEATSSNANISIIPIVENVDQSAGPFTVANTDLVRFEAIHTETSDQSATVTVKNLTDGMTTLDTFSVSLKAVGDIIPDTPNWNNFTSANTSENTNTVTISGLGTGESINISRASTGSVVVIGYKNGVSQGGGAFSVQNGDQVYWECTNFTANPISGNVTITNDTAGQFLDGFTYSLAASGGGL